MVDNLNVSRYKTFNYVLDDGRLVTLKSKDEARAKQFMKEVYPDMKYKEARND